MTPCLLGYVSLSWSISLPDGAALAGGDNPTRAERRRILDFVENALRSAIVEEVNLIDGDGDPYVVNFDPTDPSLDIEIVDGPLIGDFEDLRDELEP